MLGQTAASLVMLPSLSPKFRQQGKKTLRVRMVVVWPGCVLNLLSTPQLRGVWAVLFGHGCRPRLVVNWNFRRAGGGCLPRRGAPRGGGAGIRRIP